VDFRKVHDGLRALVRDQVQDNPLLGDMFVFRNGAKDRMKLLRRDQNGHWLLYRRLEEGTFRFNVTGVGERVEIERARLAMISEGMEWRGARTPSHHTSPFDIGRRDGMPGDLRHDVDAPRALAFAHRAVVDEYRQTIRSR
jgi:transposase